MKILKISINTSVIIIQFLLSLIIPKKDNLYILGSISGKEYSGNTKSLYEYIKKNHKNLEVYFFSKNKEILLKNKDFISPYTFKGLLLIMKAKYLIINNSIGDITIGSFILGRFNVINLWHGEPLKRIEFESSFVCKRSSIITRTIRKIQYKYIYKLGICCSDFSKKNLNKSFLNKNFKITGLPRNDIFFEGMRNKKTGNILYAPTFRNNEKILEPFSKKILKKINEYCRENELNFNIKLHPGTENIETYEDHSNINIIRHDDIQELLIKSDVLITDYSSVYIDFLLTKKPILFYAYDYNNYIKNERGMFIKYNNGIIEKGLIKNEELLLNYIKNIKKIQNNKNYKKEYNKILEFFHEYKDGNSCKRTLDEIIRLGIKKS